jgi:hypothetical protein
VTRRLAAALLGVGLLCAPTPSHSYVRTRTKETRRAAFWPRPTFALEVGDAAPAALPPQQVLDIARRSAAAWGGAQLGCTDVAVAMEAGRADTPAAAGLDGRNVLVFRLDDWCRTYRDGEPPSGVCRAPYAQGALALTTVFMDTRNGKIVEADVEVNGLHYTWVDLDDPASAARDGNLQDLENTLTHEIGHVLGLDHTCLLDGDDAAPAPDHRGLLQPRCEAASAEQKAATMFPEAAPGNRELRTLASDDVAAICAIYPLGSASAAPEGGCAFARRPGGGGGLPVAIGAALALALGLARRRGRGPGDGAPRERFLDRAGRGATLEDR